MQVTLWQLLGTGALGHQLWGLSGTLPASTSKGACFILWTIYLYVFIYSDIDHYAINLKLNCSRMLKINFGFYFGLQVYNIWMMVQCIFKFLFLIVLTPRISVNFGTSVRVQKHPYSTTMFTCLFYCVHLWLVKQITWFLIVLRTQIWWHTYSLIRIKEHCTWNTT